ncbi:MAG: hypothetical protein JOZ33_10610 [Acidobacteriaceae bacterium]|nr:hypothetical protein [Acidobacteriaceae bacterium]
MSTNEPNDTSKHLNDIGEPAPDPTTPDEISASAEPTEGKTEPSPVQARFVPGSGASTHPTG